MPRNNISFLPLKGRFLVPLLSVTAFLCCLSLPKQYVRWLLPSASAKAKLARVKTGDGGPLAVVSPGDISFSATNYSVNEGDGTANIILTRTGGTDNEVVAKVTLKDATTSPTDYRFTPGALDATFDPGVGLDLPVE